MILEHQVTETLWIICLLCPLSGGTPSTLSISWVTSLYELFGNLPLFPVFLLGLRISSQQSFTRHFPGNMTPLLNAFFTTDCLRGAALLKA